MTGTQRQANQHYANWKAVKALAEAVALSGREAEADKLERIAEMHWQYFLMASDGVSNPAPAPGAPMPAIADAEMREAFRLIGRVA